MSILKHALRAAYTDYYGKPYTNPSVTKLKASYRHHHGILHAIGCMELIPKIHVLYSSHVLNYESTIIELATLFNITSEEFLALVQVTALYHDSGRQGDGIDYWDKESSDNLYEFLRTQGIAPELALLLKLAIQYKDNQAAFMTESSKIARLSQIKATTLDVDYIRQLVNMADTFEVIRVRNEFKCCYLPILQLHDTLLLKPEFLSRDIDQIITDTAHRIYQENRAFYSNPRVVRKDKTHFTVTYHGLSRLDSQDVAFSRFCADNPYGFNLNEATVTTDKMHQAPSDAQSKNHSFYFNCLSVLIGLSTMTAGLVLLLMSISMPAGVVLLGSGALLCAFGVFTKSPKLTIQNEILSDCTSDALLAI